MSRESKAHPRITGGHVVLLASVVFSGWSLNRVVMTEPNGLPPDFQSRVFDWLDYLVCMAILSAVASVVILGCWFFRMPALTLGVSAGIVAATSALYLAAWIQVMVSI